jgi:hypothetical protein
MRQQSQLRRWIIGAALTLSLLGMSALVFLFWLRLVSHGD